MTTQPASIVEAFFHNAERQPDRTCINFDGQATSYAELRSQAERWAAALVGWGLEQGDRVGLFLENCPTFLAAYLGTHLAGGVVVLINTQYGPVELSHILSDAGVRLCLTDSARRGVLARVAVDLPDLNRIVEVGSEEAAFLAGGSSQDFRLPIGEDLAIIAYTSGTTGRSKGAMLLHRNLIANARSVCQAWRWTEADYLLLTLPLFHAHGLMVGAHGTLVAGGSLGLARRFEATEVYRRLQTEPFTMFFGVPTMYGRLLEEARQHTEPPRPLRLYVSGSAPLSPQTFEEFWRRTGQAILERYGMTETVMNLTNPYEGERRPGTVGQPFPGQQARVVDIQTRQPLSPDQTGEIEVRGPHVFAGYWRRPDATAESFDPDGWFRTGDLGLVSPDGYFTINGRAKELIITGGYNVYPREVEEVLESCPGVAEVAIIGLPDADLGEAVTAVVVKSDPNLTEQTIIDFCRERLAGFKKPRRVYFVVELPRNALGKVQKHLLREGLNNSTVTDK